MTGELWRNVQQRQLRQEKDRRKRRVGTLARQAEKVMAAGRRRGIPHGKPTKNERRK